MNITEMLVYISPGVPQAEAEPEGVLLAPGRFGSYTEMGLAAVQCVLFIGGAFNSVH